MKLNKTPNALLFPALISLLLFRGASCDSKNQKSNAQERPAEDNPSAIAPDLARTPPMGWNSWNIFRGDINEKQIREIADAMVSSGMRDAGYTFLVLDDGWMADHRDREGRLVPDPEKFPSGIEALSDYVHDMGLKFGIYQDRGHSTCMKLPGSFGHEQLDMDTFAEWGVDYLKLDSCYAEINGRKSSDDFSLFRDCISATGRPMILSMANYTDPAWAWGGREIGHLWRTSFDIQPRMRSVYYCADTSAGDIVIHPAFNGLGQFAGPGAWNDPDMLQVGNLSSDIENKTHFGLWCILAAPLIAGNDLRNMSESVRNILTAEEVIQVNQDPRGVQGYKIYDDGDHEIYNKPLSDGTTAVLMLNKGESPADLTVTWDKIGLKGRRNVRDLWQRRDLGKFQDSFTARGLRQHEHVLLKIGSPGKPLPIPEPVPPDKYMVTRTGTTFLSDLYDIWRYGQPPRYNQNFAGLPIVIDGKTYSRGFGCRAVSKIMFKLNRNADRFKAVIGLDPSYQGEETVRFLIRNEDPIGPDSILYDSGDMTKDSPSAIIDLDVRGIDCLILSLEGKEAPGNWGDALVINNKIGRYTEDSIHDAVKKGDSNSVRAILESDPVQLNALDDYRYTPLDWAATVAEWDIIELLVSKGAEVDNVGWDGGTVLHRACHYDNTDIIRLLIRRGADLHRRNQWGRTALHVAARLGHINVAALLIKNGLDLSAETKEGWTPLHVAAKSGHRKMMEFLLASGADENQKDQTGRVASEYFQPRPKPVTLDPRTYDEYVGDYATHDGFEIKIWKKNDTLYITDFSFDEMYPIGKDEFYCRHEPWKVKFTRDETGKVTIMDLSFLRRTLHCRKID